MCVRINLNSQCTAETKRSGQHKHPPPRALFTAGPGRKRGGVNLNNGISITVRGVCSVITQPPPLIVLLPPSFTRWMAGWLAGLVGRLMVALSLSRALAGINIPDGIRQMLHASGASAVFMWECSSSALVAATPSHWDTHTGGTITFPFTDSETSYHIPPPAVLYWPQNVFYFSSEDSLASVSRVFLCLDGGVNCFEHFTGWHPTLTSPRALLFFLRAQSNHKDASDVEYLSL